MAFDPIPASDVRILADIKGKIYRVLKTTELDAGAMNPAFSSISVIGTLFGTSIVFTRIKEYYKPETDTQVSVIEATLTSENVPPPVPFNIKEIDNQSILAQDVRLIVPASVFGLTSVVAYDMQLRA